MCPWTIPTCCSFPPPASGSLNSKNPPGEAAPNLPPDMVYPVAVLERSGTLGPFVQIVTHFKVWFDASVVSVLIEGAPDLYQYGLQGRVGSDDAEPRFRQGDRLRDAVKESWQEGLSFNYVNIHLQLQPGVDTALVPHNTPLFTMHPVLNRQSCKIEAGRRPPEGVDPRRPHLPCSQIPFLIPRGESSHSEDLRSWLAGRIRPVPPPARVGPCPL